MKKASSLERNRNFHICAHMFKAMMGTRVLAEIEREHLVKQTLEIIKKANPKDIRKRLRVSFKGEPGLDAGSVTKEVSAQSSSCIVLH